MLPPTSKAPDRPDFHRRLVSLAISREKDGKLRIVYAGWDNANVVRRDGYWQARRGWEADLTPLTGSADPPQKTRPPLLTPLFFTSYRGRSRASNRAFFAPVFEVALRVTAPFRYA